MTLPTPTATDRAAVQTNVARARRAVQEPPTWDRVHELLDLTLKAQGMLQMKKYTDREGARKWERIYTKHYGDLRDALRYMQAQGPTLGACPSCRATLRLVNPRPWPDAGGTLFECEACHTSLLVKDTEA